MTTTPSTRPESPRASRGLRCAGSNPNEAGPSWRWANCGSMRELLGFFVWRDVKVRYKQTVFGVAWAVLQPLATMIVFSVVFGRLAKLDSDGVPYPAFCLAGLLPWMLFASGLTQVGRFAGRQRESAEQGLLSADAAADLERRRRTGRFVRLAAAVVGGACCGAALRRAGDCCCCRFRWRWSW